MNLVTSPNFLVMSGKETSMTGRAGSMFMLSKDDGHKDITRFYFDHPVWQMKSGQSLPQMPLDVQLELINSCNLACEACPILHHTRKPSRLSWDILRKIADEAATEGVCYFTICGIGEAGLHPDLFKFLRYIRDLEVESKGMRRLSMMPTVLISNAIWSERQVQECINNPPDLLSVSLAGLHDADIIKRRGKIDLDKFYKTIKRIYENRKVVRAEDGGTSPTIHIATHIYPSEYADQAAMLQFKDKWFEIADVLVFKPTTIDEHHFPLRKFTDEGVPENLKYSNIEASHFERTAPCMETSRRISVNSDGNVWCGHHNSEEFGPPLGNVYEQSLKEIWHSEKMNRFRKNVRAGIFKRPACKACGGEIRDWHRDVPNEIECELKFSANWTADEGSPLNCALPAFSAVSDPSP